MFSGSWARIGPDKVLVLLVVTTRECRKTPLHALHLSVFRKRNIVLREIRLSDFFLGRRTWAIRYNARWEFALGITALAVLFFFDRGRHTKTVGRSGEQRAEGARDDCDCATRCVYGDWRPFSCEVLDGWGDESAAVWSGHDRFV